MTAVEGYRMELLTLMVVGFVGTVVWPISPEVSAVVYGSKLGWHPLAVGVAVAAAQVPAYALLYFGGMRLVARWGWLGRRVARTRARFETHMERGYVVLTALAAVLGVPPVLAMCALGSAFGVPFRTLMPVVAAGRVVRFSLLAGGGGALAVSLGLA